MASVLKRKNSPYWYARFMVKGRDYCISTKSTNKREAQKIAEQLEAQKRGSLDVQSIFKQVIEQLDSLPIKQADRYRSEFVHQLMRGKSTKLHIEDAWNVWLHSPMKSNPAQRTINEYHTIWQRFCTWLADSASYLHEITAIQAQDYCAYFWSQGYSPRSYNKHLKFLRAFFNTVKDKAGVINNPFEGIPTKASDYESRRNLTPEELNVICGKANDWLRYLFAIGIYTGLRLGDCVQLKWSAINFDSGIISVVPSKTRRKKEPVRIPIHPVLELLLNELCKTCTSKTYVFPKQIKVYRSDPTMITKEIQAFFESCGIETTEKPKDAHRKRAIVRVGFHSLRHSFVSLCAANRVPQVAIQELVGHGSPAMTALYSHAGDQQKIAAIAALPAILFDEE